MRRIDLSFQDLMTASFSLHIKSKCNKFGLNKEPLKSPMIDALIAGRLFGIAEERSGHAGSAYVTCKVRAATDDGELIICNVIAFNDKVRNTLLALHDGDSLSLSGALTPKVWTDKQGKTRPALDLVAHTVITTHSDTPDQE